MRSAQDEQKWLRAIDARIEQLHEPSPATPAKFPSALPTIPESPPFDDDRTPTRRPPVYPTGADADERPSLKDLTGVRRRPPRPRAPRMPAEVLEHMEMASKVVQEIGQENLSGPEKTLEFIRELGERKRRALARRQARWREEHATESARLEAQQHEIFEEIEHQQFQRVAEYEEALDSLARKYDRLLDDVHAKDSIITELSQKAPSSPVQVHPKRASTSQSEPEEDPMDEEDPLNDAVSDIISEADVQDDNRCGHPHIETMLCFVHERYEDLRRRYPRLDASVDVASWVLLVLLLFYASYGLVACMWTTVELQDERLIRDLVVTLRRQVSAQ
ncbi:hypothetical protein SPRG_16351 [Saprolegnia parasitica CBS 223.65]|uniref:PH domain-containing protein n=1 Tax=Saprolegnia parasitica (strain CBS 223.65) TaxID=695850 RepID=A0A067BIC0_SAPPC|nr:hypothetical protein SPRG_16351 [Saprolegnia parasitica CBS 223.65]KDO18144.1 hypothetical protein SPRG_16351 [Saprolegnia parasitica CBS 223.65]|eukprot:XP_012211145.1 hypothetical protein SPRG_16351 [Saprolegnia parasitica CBS 223.65]